MSEKAIISKLDDLLKPLGFTRQKTAWNRRSGYVVEVIDVQISKAGDTATINAGVLDTDAHVKGIASHLLVQNGPKSKKRLKEKPARRRYPKSVAIDSRKRC